MSETESGAGIISSVDQETLASRLPTPDFYINAYSGCSTGQQWDEIAYRIFDKEIPIFKVSFPHLWAIKPDAGYLRGEEWDEVSRYIADQLYAMVEWIELQTGRPFDWDALRESMWYIKRAAEIRLEAIELCTGGSDAGDVLGLDREHRSDQLPAGQPGPRRLLRRRQAGDRAAPA